MTDMELMALAHKAREQAYCPYSGFAVGAALLDADGNVWTGCNIENAAYGPTNCAERTAFFKAVSEGVRKFDRIAITGGPADQAPKAGTAPCGVCRQVMAEFCTPDFVVLLADEQGGVKSLTLAELFPFGFGPTSL
ncbi:MAG: cytidine deaminase [Oscillospiraceae bacterium]|nr:cytidine deaminase [Oscillospiraceae bacterium]